MTHLRSRLVACIAAGVVCISLSFSAAPAARADSAQSGPALGTWFSLANRHLVLSVAVDPASGSVWSGTAGGAVRWDRRTGTYTGYTPPDGLPLAEVQAVAIDTGGRTWFGTSGGGVGVLDPSGRWSQLHASPDGLPSDSISAIVVAPDGSLWFATSSSGAGHRAVDGTWTRYRVTQGLPSNELQDLAVDAAGNTWFGTNEGLSRRATDGRFTTFTSADGMIGDNIRALAVDATGSVWAGTYDGLSRRKADGSWDSFLEGQAVLALAVGGDGAVWAGTAGEGVVRLRDDVVTSFSTADGLPHDYVYALATDSEGRVWAGTEEGLAHRSPSGTWITDRTSDPPLDAHVTAVVPETGGGAAPVAGGGTWFGTLAGVGHQAADGAWTVYTPTSTNGGLPSNNVNAMALDRAGSLWVGTANGIGQRGPDGTWTRYTSMSTGGGLAHNYVNGMVALPDGTLWFATLGGISRRAPDGSWSTVTRESTAGGLPDDRVFAVAADPDGSLWFGTFAGASRLGPDGIWATYSVTSTAGGLPHDRVEAVHVDTGGNRWFGTLGGVGRLAADGTWSTFTMASTGGGLPEDEVRVITSDGGGNLWLGTPVGAARLAADGTWTTYTVADGLADDRVLAIAAVERSGPGGGTTVGGELWFGTYGGATRGIPRQPGATCADALPVTPDGVAVGRLDPAAVHIFQFDVEEPFSRVEANLPDLDDRLDATLFRSCDPSSGGEVPLAGARLAHGETRLAWDALSRPGSYFLMLRAKAGVEAGQPIPYRLRLGFVPAPAAGATAEGGPRTLILTHVPRIRELYGLKENDPELVAWLERLDRLAARPEVAGAVVRDVERETSAEVAAAYATWQADPTAAFVFARALRAWIWQQRARFPRLMYVVLAGDDRIIPHMWMSISPIGSFESDRDQGWRLEDDYIRAAELDPAVPPVHAMNMGWTLTDDFYGWPSDTGHGIALEPALPPQVAIGRLIERPRDMTAVIDAYLATDGVLSVSDSLVAGTGLGVPAASEVDAMLAGTGLAGGSRAKLVGDSWGSGDLRPLLTETPHAFNFLAIPTWHDAFVAPDHAQVRAGDIALGSPMPGGALVIATGSHAGLNVPVGTGARPLDLPEAWARRGATVIAATGWTYGTDVPDASGWQTTLGVSLAHVLLQGRGMAIGDALIEAKRTYLSDHPGSAFHDKTAAGTMLYGLPMLRIAPPGPGLGQAGPPGTDSAATAPLQARGESLAPVAGAAGVWLRADQRYSFSPDSMWRQTTSGGDYWTFGGQAPHAESGQYVQPAARLPLWSVDRDDQSLMPGGVVLRHATYREASTSAPLVARACTLGLPEVDPGQAGGRLDRDRDPYPWYPAWPVVLGNGVWLAPSSLAPGVRVGRETDHLRFTLGQYQPRMGVERLIDSVVLDEYYTATPSRHAWVFEPVAVLPMTDATLLRFRASGSAGSPDVVRVVAAYTAADSAKIGAGAWESVELVRDVQDGVWEGTIPPGTSAVIQAVSAVGEVKVDTNGGRLWPCAVCAGESVVFLPTVKR